jgi:hypothetical protein
MENWVLVEADAKEMEIHALELGIVWKAYARVLGAFAWDVGRDKCCWCFGIDSLHRYEVVSTLLILDFGV